MKDKNEITKSQWQEISEKLNAHKVPEFPKSFRGYDCNEVDLYLNFLVDSYLKLYEENQILQKEIDEYHSIKEDVFRLQMNLSEDSDDDFVFTAPDEPLEDSFPQLPPYEEIHNTENTSNFTIFEIDNILAELRGEIDG